MTEHGTGDVTSSGGDTCEIHAQSRSHRYVMTTQYGGDDRLHIDVSGCDRDGQVVVQMTGQVPVDELEVVARLFAAAARLHQPASAATPVRDEHSPACSPPHPSGRYVVPTDERAYTVEGKRQEHPNAYRPWTEDEEHELVRLHREAVRSRSSPTSSVATGAGSNRA